MSKAPDKIFVLHYDEPLSSGQIGSAWSSQIGLHNEAEYIRKDALLEWLKIAEECYSHPDPANVVDTIRCEGKKWAFQDVINKIESL